VSTAESRRTGSRRRHCAAPLARPPPGSALKTPARHGRAAAARQLPQIRKHIRHAVQCCPKPSSSLPAVQLAATASSPPFRAPLRGGFASLGPAATPKDSAPARKSPGKPGRLHAGLAQIGEPEPEVRMGGGSGTWSAARSTGTTCSSRRSRTSEPPRVQENTSPSPSPARRRIPWCVGAVITPCLSQFLIPSLPHRYQEPRQAEAGWGIFANLATASATPPGFVTSGPGR
jgi:hypothetical protein